MAEGDDIKQNIYNSRVEMKSYTGVSKDDTNSENDGKIPYTIERKKLTNEEGIICNQSPNNNTGNSFQIIQIIKYFPKNKTLLFH